MVQVKNKIIFYGRQYTLEGSSILSLMSATQGVQKGIE